MITFIQAPNRYCFGKIQNPNFETQWNVIVDIETQLTPVKPDDNIKMFCLRVGVTIVLMQPLCVSTRIWTRIHFFINIFGLDSKEILYNSLAIMNEVQNTVKQIVWTKNSPWLIKF
jgi:hypothetical protein